MITNKQIAEALTNIANALEEQDENPYRIRAYRRAANAVKKHLVSINDLVSKEADLTCIPYVGTRIAEVIKKIIKGEDLDIISKPIPAQPYPEALRNKPRKLIFYKIYSIYFLIEKMIATLKQIPVVKKVEVAGDYRRKKEVVSDFDILVVSTDNMQLFSLFHSFPAIKYIVETTADRTTVQLKLGIRITLRSVKESEWGRSLLFYTGSGAHYEQLEEQAQRFAMSLNDKNAFIAMTEKQIFEHLKLQYIPPELRESRGEVEAASLKQLPKLIQLSDIKGDLHCHTNETDGFFSLEEMVQAAKSHGYEYVAITDHSQSLRITHGMDEKRLLKQMELIDELNEKCRDFKILKSMEVDILEDGSLDLSQRVLMQLDLTVCSVHSKFRLSAKDQTKRIIKAMDNPCFNILGHATGRLLKYRAPYEIEMDEILLAAKERNCFIEVNAQPARLDINDWYCKKAKEIGVKVAISSDAHTTNGFNYMLLGINQARRGWLEKEDVINTHSLNELKILLKK